MYRRHDDLHGAGYEALANAIIIQAVKDYKTALRRLKTTDDEFTAAEWGIMTYADEKARKTRLEAFCRWRDALGRAESHERLFRSGWYAGLTDVDGDYLIERTRKEMKIC